MVTGHHWWDYGEFLWLSLCTKINLYYIYNKNIQMHGTIVITLDRDISCFRNIHKSENGKYTFFPKYGMFINAEPVVLWEVFKFLSRISYGSLLVSKKKKRRSLRRLIR